MARPPFVMNVGYETWRLENALPFDTATERDPAETAALQARKEELLEELAKIAPEEVDIVNLTEQGVTQAVIGRLLGISQVAVCYKLRRAKQRLAWLAKMPPPPDDLIEQVVGACINDRRTTEEVAALAAVILDAIETGYCRASRTHGMSWQECYTRCKIYIAKLSPEAQAYAKYRVACPGNKNLLGTCRHKSREGK